MSEQRTKETLDAQRISNWQRRLRECPVVWLVMVRCDGEESLDGAYQSEEAANLAKDWFNSRNKGGYYGKARVTKYHMESLELAQERFT